MQDTASAQAERIFREPDLLITAPLKEHRRNKPCNNVQHQAVELTTLLRRRITGSGKLG